MKEEKHNPELYGWDDGKIYFWDDESKKEWCVSDKEELYNNANKKKGNADSPKKN